MNSDIIPERLVNPLNYKIILLIIGGVILFQTSLYVVPESESDNIDLILSGVALVNPISVAIASFVIWTRYRSTKIFGRAYFSLGLAYVTIVAAEITYITYDIILHQDPYPSIADVFFFAMYPFTLIHLILNIRFFKPDALNKDKILLMAIPAGIILTYVMMFGHHMTYEEKIPVEYTSFEYYFGLMFIAASAITLAFAISAAKIFREGVLGTVWLLLVVGILANTVGDVWYYHIEIFAQYDLIHPVNMFWYASYWLIIYALIKHKKLI